MKKTISLTKISFSYLNHKVLHDISINIENGRFVGVVGPNGSGKSTLLKLLSGIIKPGTGNYSLYGKSFSSYSLKERALLVSYCPQNPSVSFPFSSLDVVLMARTPRLGILGLPGQTDLDAAMQALSAVDASYLSGKCVDELSGGEFKRVMIARAFAQDTSIMLLDEPSEGLDLKHRISLMSILKEVTIEGKLVIAVLHDLDEASSCCDDLILMKNGRIFSYGSPMEVLSESNIQSTFDVKVSAVTLPGGRRIILPSRS